MFDEAMGYVATYRANRKEALNNQKCQRWFLSDVASIDQIFKLYFNSDEENQKWLVNAMKPRPNMIVGEGWRLKIAWLAGSRRDLREQFACDTDHRIRSRIHRRCFEYIRLMFVQMRAQVFSMIAGAKCGP